MSERGVRSYKVLVGMEVHVQLATATKMFAAVANGATNFGAEPNTLVDEVVLGLPGVLPVMNRRAVEFAIRFGLAVNGGSAENVSRRSIFARKNYFYPDLPKGYQISQYEIPVVQGGTITIQVEGRQGVYEKTVNLTRAHLEEDAGKSLHEDFANMTGIDLKSLDPDASPGFATQEQP